MTAYSETGLCSSQPVIITDANTVGILEELLGFLLDEFIETFRTVLLHSLKAHQQVDGKFNASLLMGLNDIEPAKDRAFIVCGTPSVKSISLGIVCKDKWFCCPPVIFQSRLTISSEC